MVPRAPPPRVTVVLPVHNAERFVAEAVRSILAQSLAAFELVVIDDGSTDGSPRILAELAAREPRIRLVSQANRGLPWTLNRALADATTDYVALMNHDDVSLPARLEKQAAFLDVHPRVAAVGAQTRLIDAAGSRGPTTTLPRSPAEVRSFLAEASPLAHPSVMLRRAAALAAGGYRPQMALAEDYDLWLRLAERHDLANLPEVLLEYRVHPDQWTAAACESVALATLVARAAARRRAAGLDDPVEGRPTVDRAVAAELGIGDADLARAAILAALSRAESILAAGGPDAAAWTTLESLRFRPAAALEPRLLTAAQRWLEGRILFRGGRPARAASLLIQAALVEPTFRRRLTAALRRRQPGRPRRRPG